MERRDILKDEVERLGRVLGKILADLLDWKAKGNLSQGIAATAEALKSELDLDLNTVLGLDRSALTEYLDRRAYTDAHLEILVDMLLEMGTAATQVAGYASNRCFHSALDILDAIDSRSSTLSFDRVHQRSRIEHLLHDSENP